MIIAKNLVQERLNGITPHENCARDQPVIKSGATECVIFIAWYFFEEVFELLTSRDIQTLQAGCVRQLMSWNEDQCMQSGSIRTGAPGGDIPQRPKQGQFEHPVSYHFGADL